MAISSVALLLVKEKSRRLPNKNTLPYKGEPMYMTNVRKCLKIFEEVYVSSDSEEILDNVENIGAIGILRSQHLCGECPNIPVYHHAIGFMHPANAIVAVQANSPTIEPEVILKVKEHIENGADEVMTCHENGEIYGSVWGLSMKKLKEYKNPRTPMPAILVVDKSLDIHTLEEYNSIV